VAAAALLLVSNFAGPVGAQFKKDVLSNPPIPCEDVDSVGTAKMSADGTITLQLRSLSPNPIAEGQLVYATDDPQYGEIKRHLGGITPGESKRVPPWCGTNSEP
jgi:hypothetical protein